MLIIHRNRIHLVSNRYAETANEKEKWYGTAYAAESLPHELLSKVSSSSC